MSRLMLFVFLFFLNFISFAQKEKEDEYLKNLAKKIQFENKELYFKEGSLEAMKDVVHYINSNEGYYLITSNTSLNGSANANQKLTSFRAKMIKRLMVNLGVDSLKIRVAGLGENYPISSHPSKEDDRIEITVYEKKK
ncbi:OmpA family protein [Tenacibaculum sp. SZ-18]|uniref:OmpA family protein n=1 Tax=Tenacibaculum sp. SZ-18 TaxID=754423 RepID=UPI000C2D0493|nr:OmpA family protein [Tenacibaculum sp. SZ-18]